MTWETLLAIATAMGLREAVGWVLTRQRRRAESEKILAEAHEINARADSGIYKDTHEVLAAVIAELHSELNRMSDSQVSLRNDLDTLRIAESECQEKNRLLQNTVEQLTARVAMLEKAK